MRKIRLYKYPDAPTHVHDTIPAYRNSVPFSEDGIKKWCEPTSPAWAEYFYCGQFADNQRRYLTPDRFPYFKGNESKHIIDLEGDHSDQPIPAAFRNCLFTAMNATPDKRKWKLLVRPPCSMLLMDMVKHPRQVANHRQPGQIFIGKRDSQHKREQLKKKLEYFRAPIHWEWTDTWNAMTPVDSPVVRHYEEEMSQWTEALCPPGEGIATVRFYEACGLGLKPVVYDDHPKFMEQYAPPHSAPELYFKWVQRYFADPTRFFFEYFGITAPLNEKPETHKIVCVSVPPSYQEPNDDYVGRLHRALKRNLTQPFEFEVRRENPYNGWWNKVLLFPPKERIVYLDLDTVIVGNVDFLFDYYGDFCILRDFYHQDGYGSAIMNIAAGFGANITKPPKDVLYHPVWGDQDWIRQCVPKADFWQQLFPKRIVSFKAHNCEQGLPEGAKIVAYHGRPKPPDTLHIPWVKEHWI